MKILVVSFLLASACKTGAAPAPKATESAAPPAAAVAFDGMDLSVSPGDDFFAYTNGGWFKTTEIPADRSSWGTFAGLAELTAKRTAELIAEATRADAPAGSDARKIGDYYATFLDEAGIEAKGLAPLQPKLDAIAALHDAQGLAQALGSTVRADVDVLNNTNLYTANVLGLWVAQDLDDPTRYSPFLLQGGVTMPDRDHYLNPSARMVEIRAKYQAHVAALLKLAGAADGEAKAARIFELERRLAESHTSRGESEDVLKGNNHWSRAELEKRAPGLDWKTFLAAAGLGDRNEFVIWQPAALIGLAALVKSAPLSNWKEYLTFHALSRAAPLLPKAFVDETFNFFGKVLSGTPQLRDRWKRAVDATDAALGEAVGKLYVAKYFPPSEKARAEEMVKNELAAFAKRIDKLEWMAPATREQAKQKVAALKVGVGYPDKWRDYSALEVVRGDALGNAERAGLFELKRNLARLGQPVDRGEGGLAPQPVNAVNLPALNALNFPAAILQPPFFDPARPAAMDYGATGATIGHGISHSFDDQGALFDASGRGRNWWTDAAFAPFKARSEAVAKQFAAYQPFPDLHVDGKQTLSENIADVAGLAAAFDAYRLSLGGKEPAMVQGLTGDQQFFVSYGQSWRAKYREPALRQRIVIDGHAPAEYRADTVRNQDAWYEAFLVKPGQKLYLAPAERVRVW